MINNFIESSSEKNILKYIIIASKMQSKKYVNNSELPVFNIRKVNKKATVIAKNIGEVNYFNPEADHFIDHEFQNFSSVHKVVDARKEK